MAAISPTFSTASGVVRTIWTAITSADTASEFTLSGNAGAFASVQITGTFGGTTVTFQGSNDGTNWVTLNDMTNTTAISLTSAGLREFRTSALYVRPLCTGGSGYSINVTCVFRGK